MKTLKAERIQRQTVQAQVYEQLREAIMRGEFQPGQSLSIRNVAAELETSTMPVRDAFTRLSVEGAIEISVNRRPMIPAMTVERLEEITRLRTVLEGMATEMAASRISPEALAELAGTCQRMQTAADENRIDEYLAENWRFHRRIYAASGSEMLNSVIEMMWLRVGPCIRLCIPATGHFTTSMACHWKRPGGTARIQCRGRQVRHRAGHHHGRRRYQPHAAQRTAAFRRPSDSEESRMSILSRLRPDTGLRVLVTAGASGIGRRIVEGYREAGARIAVCDISEAALEQFRHELPDATALHCDVAEGAAVDAMVQAAAEALGGFDVVINNAGIAGPTGTVEAIEPADWERTLRVNLDSQYYVAHATARALKHSRGSMINIASVAGRLGYAYRTPYAASKWAIVGFTKSLAAEMGPDGVRVNAILPGIVQGERIDRVIQARGRQARRVLRGDGEPNLANVSLQAHGQPRRHRQLACS
jgi:NAD(P)-dependent dehydrogenase (short-subunit alcohol dehydrogenase family)/DNA-binding GntR family transcriptional regulator